MFKKTTKSTKSNRTATKKAAPRSYSYGRATTTRTEEAETQETTTRTKSKSDFIRLTALFETEKGNLIGSTREDVSLHDGTVIPSGTTFMVVAQKPFNGQAPKFPYSLVAPPPR